MSQNPGSPIVRKTQAKPNVYSVLAIVATLAVGLAFGFVAYHNSQISEQGNPFKVVEPDQMDSANSK